ncbi:hypothetical protein SAMN05192588_1329 [Nonlabens sp. Hel1_33_55]|uniref:EamA family transporter n=1 Tax=Nonlabens sp. Hel1_33_55 TaxID=1336802 RepID=UPI000875BFF1|nr:hypothetical protein [Nonlabens sp. Hel1_33_55]SCY13717.1 hypothetical protein SAMN05192588_1329 [Nonlabens sp. Hel1_33_55]
MIWLVLSVLTSSLLYVIFKYFKVFEVNTLHAIVINYLVAAITGLLVYEGEISTIKIFDGGWFWFSVVLGALFITVFNILGLTSQKNGLSVAAVASKMSLIIPVIFGIWMYNETLGWLKITGVFIALASVYLASLKSKDGLTIHKKELLLPALLFLGSGIIDTTIKYAEKNFVPDGDEPLFSAICFVSAFGIGILILIYEAIQGRRLQFKSIIAGITLGIPNYFSIYFLIKALKNGMESSVFFPINHVGTVLFTTLLGYILFKERLLIKNYWGIALAVVAIICIAFAKA